MTRLAVWGWGGRRSAFLVPTAPSNQHFAQTPRGFPEQEGRLRCLRTQVTRWSCGQQRKLLSKTFVTIRGVPFWGYGEWDKTTDQFVPNPTFKMCAPTLSHTRRGILSSNPGSRPPPRTVSASPNQDTVWPSVHENVLWDRAVTWKRVRATHTWVGKRAWRVLVVWPWAPAAAVHGCHYHIHELTEAPQPRVSEILLASLCEWQTSGHS